MRFASASLAAALAVCSSYASPSSAAFAPLSSVPFALTTTTSSAAAGRASAPPSHGGGCSCPKCSPPSAHAAGCPCPSCVSLLTLRMSEVAEGTSSADADTAPAAAAAAADVPPEVEALDGVADTSEAHNVERPARSSIAKRRTSTGGGGTGGGNKPGTPLTDLRIGSEVTGTVKAIQSYGAFVDIGAQTDALLHVSRLSDDFVSNVEDVVKAGDSVTVRIVSVDPTKGQVAVTMRSAEAETRAAERQAGGGGGGEGGGRRRERPRRSGGDRGAQMETLKALAEKGYDDEAFVEGNVVSTLDFGAFVRFDASQLAEGVTGELDGLVHISALTVGRCDDVSSVCTVGDTVKVRVRSVDAEGGRVSLSMISKADEPKPREGGGRGGGGGRQRAPRPRWSPEEMGAADWRESMQDIDQPAFANTPIVVDRRK